MSKWQTGWLKFVRPTRHSFTHLLSLLITAQTLVVDGEQADLAERFVEYKLPGYPSCYHDPGRGPSRPKTHSALYAPAIITMGTKRLDDRINI